MTGVGESGTRHGATSGWTLIVPVKPLTAAKSRLRGALPDVPHEQLALALALDTVAAALHQVEVLVVTDDRTAGSALAALGARIVPDGPGQGLNQALEYGARLAGAPRRRVGALTADLPALQPADLAGVLAAAAGTRAYVADAAGTGTTVLLAGPDGALDPRFGSGSALAHAASGARRVDAPPGVRRDIDTTADLAAARVIGLGRHTAALIDGWPDALDGAGYGAGMQATVATFDERTHAGTVLLDDGREIGFPAAAFDASGLRLLRLGQRVRIDRNDEGEIVHLTLPTF